MKPRSLFKYFDWAICLVAVTLGLVGCARDVFSGLQISQVQELGDDCSVPATASPLTHTSGVFDVDLPVDSPSPYVLPILVVNNLASVGTGPDELNNIILTHFTVQLSADGMTWDASCPSKFDSPTFTHMLTPGGGAFGTEVEVLTPHHAQCLLAALNPQPNQEPRYVLVTATIQAEGSHGGTKIESAPFDYPIAVCTGCLQQNYGIAALDAVAYPNRPMCADVSDTSSLQANNTSCMPLGEDARFFCCGLTQTTGECYYITNKTSTTP